MIFIFDLTWRLPEDKENETKQESIIMNISPITSGSGGVLPATDTASQIRQLELQRMKLEQQSQKINASQDDAKTKAREIQKLQLQIQSIDAQIQQIRQTSDSQATAQAAQTKSSDASAGESGALDLTNTASGSANGIIDVIA